MIYKIRVVALPCVCLAMMLSFQASDAMPDILPYGLTAKELRQSETDARSGDKDACKRVAVFYVVVRNDFRAALEWYGILAKMGDRDGVYGMGTCYEHLGDINQASKLYVEAKRLGHPYAASALESLAAKQTKAR